MDIRTGAVYLALLYNNNNNNTREKERRSVIHTPVFRLSTKLDKNERAVDFFLHFTRRLIADDYGKRRRRLFVPDHVQLIVSCHR